MYLGLCLHVNIKHERWNPFKIAIENSYSESIGKVAASRSVTNFVFKTLLNISD